MDISPEIRLTVAIIVGGLASAGAAGKTDPNSQEGRNAIGSGHSPSWAASSSSSLRSSCKCCLSSEWW
jgi:hypothetical protein